MRNKTQLILIGIVFIAAVLRFWQVGTNPPSLTWDEVSWGYNAYSLGTDLRDEFGKFLPITHLESFGDFKPPVYAYLDILPVKIFGLTEFAVRFPSAFLGTITVFLTYFLVRRIFPHRDDIALASAFFLAISPWHINLSRAAFEANVATFFIVLGVWSFLAGVSNKRWFFVLSAVSFALSLYTFNSARVVVPILAVILAIGFRKELLNRKKETIIALLVGVLMVAPAAQFFTTYEAGLRFKEVNIFSDLGVIERLNKQVFYDKDAIWSKLLHNRRQAFGVEYLRHYFDHFNPSFLFIKGDGNPKFSTQDVGQMYLWELPFFVAGILFLLRQRLGKWWIVPLWLLAGIIPAGTARETPHALRIESVLPTFQIFTAYGFVIFAAAVSNIKNLPAGKAGQIAKIQIKYLIFSLCFLFLLLNILYYLHGYYVHYPRTFSGEWQYGYKESIAYINNVANKYDKIIVTTDLGRPYIYYLFYTQTQPQEFRKTAQIKKDVHRFVHVDGFGKYTFTRNLAPYHKRNIKTLYINSPNRVPGKASVLKVFKLLNGNPILVAYVL